MKKIIIISLSVFLLLFGCGTKKKIVNNLEKEVLISKKIDSASTNKLEKVEKTKDVSVIIETEEEESFEYLGKKGDTLKVTKKGANGKILSETTYTGSGKITKTKKTKAKNISSETEKEVIEKKDSKVAVKKDIEGKITEKSKHIDIEKSGFRFMTYVWIFLVIAFLVSLWYLNEKFNLISKIRRFIKVLLN